MSGPNTSYDPVQVAPLSAENVEAMVADAFAAFAAATTVAELKQARLAHAGDRSPIALANREIGALPPQARKEAGAGSARPGADQQGPARQRETEISAAELEQRLRDERVDVTLPVELHPQGAVHPITALMQQMEDVFVAMGWEVAEGPEVEAEWLNFDALNFIPDHPARTMQDTIFVEPADGGIVLRTHTSPVQARALLTRELPGVRRLPRQGLPRRRVRRDPSAGLPSDRRPGRGQGHHPRSSAGRTRPLRPSHVRRHPDPDAAELLPVHRAERPRSTCSASSATATRSVTRTIRAGPVAARAGSSGAAAEW